MQRRLEHLGVPRRTEDVGQPLQLGPQRPGVRAGVRAGIRPSQHRREGLQRAAQPPGGDPHVVHRLRLVPAHPGVGGLHLGDLIRGVGQDHLAGRGPGGQRRRRRGLRKAPGQRPGQLGRVPGRAQPGLAQPLVDRLEQVRVAAGELDLDLPPRGQRGAVPHRLGGDLVDRHLGQGRAAAVEQGAALPDGADLRDRAQGGPAGPAADKPGQLGGHPAARPGPAAAGSPGGCPPRPAASGASRRRARRGAAAASPRPGSAAGHRCRSTRRTDPRWAGRSPAPRPGHRTGPAA